MDGFNPRSPQGAIQETDMDVCRSRSFNPRSPQGAILQLSLPGFCSLPALIPAPRRERFHRHVEKGGHGSRFNPRSPQGAIQQNCTNFNGFICAILLIPSPDRSKQSAICLHKHCVFIQIQALFRCEPPGNSVCDRGSHQRFVLLL